jgi:hypothetical protein
MQRIHKKMVLVLGLVLVIGLPFIGGFIRWKGLPPGFGIYPTQHVMEKPGFNIFYFIFAACVALFITIFYLFPRWFGFKYGKKKPLGEKHVEPKARFPLWFWIGLSVCLFGWAAQWGKFEWLGYFKYLTFVPLWWGFIFAVDGWVYKRTGGASIIGSEPMTMLVLAVVSIVGWGIFEYLNFFVIENWHYPNGYLFSTTGFIILSIFSFTVVRPSIFVVYTLLGTFQCLTRRYAHGPRLNLPANLRFWVFAAGLLLTFGIGLFPHMLFWSIWLGPLLLLTGMISMLGFWTPFTPIERGNWNPVIIIGLAALVTGFFWEFWNYGSMFFRPEVVTNPNYWEYDIPYVNKWCLFSEMPLLGYFGYLPFGVLNWIWWVLSADLFNLSPDLRFSELLHLDGQKDHE